MAGTINGNFKSLIGYSSALRQGTGWNPIHANATMGPPLGVRANLQLDSTETLPGTGIEDDEIATDWSNMEAGSFEDQPSVIWGYGTQSGISELGPWSPSSDDVDMRATTGEDYPPWGPYKGGSPGGTAIRTDAKGNLVSVMAKEDPDDNAAQGWINKNKSTEDDAVVSDPRQYEMQTSMTQRNKVRAGSQISGTASEYEAPVASRITGKKVKDWAAPTSVRHQDMYPYQQDYIIRPFWLRNAGTGPRPWMKANDLYESQAYSRMPPDNPYPGPQVHQVAADTSQNYGYTEEDITQW